MRLKIYAELVSNKGKTIFKKYENIKVSSKKRKFYESIMPGNKGKFLLESLFERIVEFVSEERNKLNFISDNNQPVQEEVVNELGLDLVKHIGKIDSQKGPTQKPKPPPILKKMTF